MINWVLHVQNAILDGITQIHISNISCMKENSDRFFVPNKSHEVNDERYPMNLHGQLATTTLKKF